jgi:hypothetical protein
MDLRGDSAEGRFRHLQDAIRRWDDEWAAFHLQMSPEVVTAIRESRQSKEEAASRKRSKAGKQTAKKMKERAALHKKAVLDAYHEGYPRHIGPRNRVSHVVRKTGLSAPTVRKYLPGLKRKKTSSSTK